MKYYSQKPPLQLFDLDAPLACLPKVNRWVRLGDTLPWDKIEIEYNKRLKNQNCGAGNKPARMVIAAVYIKHYYSFSDEATIEIIRENPYMQYFAGLTSFIYEPIFDPSLFVTIRKRLGEDFFNIISREVASVERKSKEKEEVPPSDEDKSNSGTPSESLAKEPQEATHSGVLKVDATCCDAEMRYPVDHNLLEDASRFLSKMLEKFCSYAGIKIPSTHRSEARAAYLSLVKKKFSGRKLRDQVKRVQIRCFEADIQIFFRTITSDFARLTNASQLHSLQAVFALLRQQKQMLEDKTYRCADRIVSIFQPHVRPIVRGKARTKTEFGAKVGAAIVNGYTYLDHISWDAYNESADLALHIERYRERFGCYPAEVQADKIYMTKENRRLLESLGIAHFCPPLGRPPKHVDPEIRRLRHKASCERNEIEASFGTAKRIYGANDIRAKRPDTSVSWIGACFFVKNIKKFLRGLFVSIFRLREFGPLLRRFFLVVRKEEEYGIVMRFYCA